MLSPGAWRGRRLVITRQPSQSTSWVNRLQELGAEVIELPLIRVEGDDAPDRAEEVWADIGHYEWLLFTSVNGVHHFFDLFFRRFDDIRALGMLRLGAVGPTVAEALRHFHLRVDVTPAVATAEELAKALEQQESLDNLRILVVTGNRNREVLVERLEAARAIVDTLQVYHTEANPISDNPAAQRFREVGADAIVFASPSAAESFAAQSRQLQLAPGARQPIACSLGPATSAALRRLGVPVAVETAQPGLDPLLEALDLHWSR